MTTSKLSPGAPMDEQRLEEIAHHLRGGVRGFEGELLALATWLAVRLEAETARADECELWCGRFARDEGYQNGREAGVREALAVINDEIEWQTNAMKSSGSDLIRLLAALRGLIQKACGDTSPPPHERTVARCRRYEEALRKIADMTAHQGLELSRECGRMAMNALGGEP